MPLNRRAGMSQVLVLNASYEPLNITTWRRALVMMMKGKAESLEQDSSRKIRHDTLLPTVIRLNHFVRVPLRELPVNRKNVLHRDSNCCQYCGYSGEKLSIDHIIPKSRGGKDTWENVTTACLNCNLKKGNRTPKEADMALTQTPHKPMSSLRFEATKQINAGFHKEWKKYVIGWN